jgi:hypothetical protein
MRTATMRTATMRTATEDGHRGRRSATVPTIPKLYRFLVMFDKARMNKGFRDENGGHCQ